MVHDLTGETIHKSNFKKLEGWFSFTEAAEEMGISRQAFHERWFKAGKIRYDHVRIAGKMMFMISEEELNRLKKLQEQTEFGKEIRRNWS